VGGILKIKTLFLIVSMILVFSCEDQIVSECDDRNKEFTSKTTFNDIQNLVFTSSCATSGCHTANNVTPDLSEGQAYNNIVNVVSTQQSIFLVTPFKSDSSYLINKLRGVNNQGAQMPLNSQPLSAATIDSIAAWIDRGANR